MLQALKIVRTVIVAALLLAALMAGLALPADARGGGHGFGRGFAAHGRHGPQFAGGRRHGNDDYVKAASDDRDKLLTDKIKSICRGC
jgi:Spy/CpxP family protein refolding chaperone